MIAFLWVGNIGMNDNFGNVGIYCILLPQYHLMISATLCHLNLILE